MVLLYKCVLIVDFDWLAARAVNVWTWCSTVNMPCWTFSHSQSAAKIGCQRQHRSTGHHTEPCQPSQSIASQQPAQY